MYNISKMFSIAKNQNTKNKDKKKVRFPIYNPTKKCIIFNPDLQKKVEELRKLHLPTIMGETKEEYNKSVENVDNLEDNQKIVIKYKRPNFFYSLLFHSFSFFLGYYTHYLINKKQKNII